MPALLKTHRLTIRAFRGNDLDKLYSILSKPTVMKYIEPPFNRKQTEDFLREHAFIAEPDILALTDSKDEQLIGQIIFHKYDEVEEGIRFELGWILDEEYWGKGMAQEVTEAMIEYAKETGLHSLIIECAPSQEASQRIAVKNGFRKIEEGDLLVFEKILCRTGEMY